MTALAIVYLVTGVLLTKSWPRYAEPGKTFLVLVFPAHVALYLVLAGFTARQIRDGMRNLIIIVLLLILFVLLTR